MNKSHLLYIERSLDTVNKYVIVESKKNEQLQWAGTLWKTMLNFSSDCKRDVLKRGMGKCFNIMFIHSLLVLCFCVRSTKPMCEFSFWKKKLLCIFIVITNFNFTVNGNHFTCKVWSNNLKRLTYFGCDLDADT